MAEEFSKPSRQTLYQRDCITVRQSFGAGDHGANPQLAEADGPCVRSADGCGAVIFEATALLNAVAIVNRSDGERARSG